MQQNNFISLMLYTFPELFKCYSTWLPKNLWRYDSNNSDEQ